MLLRILIVAGCLWGISTVEVQAQFTRDSGAGSIAGTLQKANDDYDDFEFSSKGSQVLFVDLDAEVYRNGEPHDEHDDHDTNGTDDLTVAAESSSTHEDSGEEGGCAGGGNASWALEVLSSDQTQICIAGKPQRPGWDTDPRMACHIADPGDYILRVTFVSKGGHHETADVMPPIHPYLLNVSLRDVVSDRSGLSLNKAIKESVNHLPFDK